MNDTLFLFVWVAVVAVAFGALWRMGYLVRLSKYILDTREELKKCTWPTREELKGSTILVVVAILLLGGFTVVVDLVLVTLVRFIV